MFKAKTFSVWLSLCCIISLGFWSYYFLINSRESKVPGFEKPKSTVLGVKQAHTKQFFEEKLFYQGVTQAKIELQKNPQNSLEIIKGGIVPHHLFPSFILSGFFQRLEEQNKISEIKQVIIIGPNHAEEGQNWALTSKYAWNTPFGAVEPDLENINALTENNLIQINEPVLSLEHSIGGITPYLKYYLPNAKITPIIVKYKISPENLENLSQKITNLASGSDTVIISSVDFSHYLPANVAKNKDKTTLKILQNYNYSKLLTLNNDYIDSPASIAVLLKTMEKLQTTKQNLLYHTNSGELQNDFSGQTTSYICMSFSTSATE